MLKMEVKEFSKQIVLAAYENAKGRTFPNYVDALIVGIGTVVSDFLTIRLLGNPIYHASGALAYMANRIPDIHITYKNIKLSEDPRFKEYGIGKHCREANPTLPEHPSRKDILNIKQIALQVGFGILSTIYPPLGHGHSALSPFLYESNSTIKKSIEKAFEIGDDVKLMIETGLKREDVNMYLNLLIDRKNTCNECKVIHGFK
jgi:hypothetical protein